VGGHRWGIPDHSMVNGGAWEPPRHSAMLVRLKRGLEVERREGVHGVELSGELGCAPASDSCGRDPYHDKPRRAWDAWGGSSAQGRMQWLAMSGGGRDGKRRRGRLRCSGGGERMRALLLLARGWSGGGVASEAG
jgi:hypothetical protein